VVSASWENRFHNHLLYLAKSGLARHDNFYKTGTIRLHFWSLEVKKRNLVTGYKVMSIQSPYLLFIGDVPDALAAKTAQGVVDWRPERCAGQMRMEGCGADLGIPDMTIL